MFKKCVKCGKDIGKRRRKFCSNQCKDKYHNLNNPRGKFAYLKDSKSIEDDFHPFDSYCFGKG